MLPPTPIDLVGQETVGEPHRLHHRATVMRGDHVVMSRRALVVWADQLAASPARLDWQAKDVG
jgi:hypothetical protein